MLLPERLETLSLDCQTGKFLLNGETISNVDQFNLEFNNGGWNLHIHQHRFFSATGKAVSEDTAQN